MKSNVLRLLAVAALLVATTGCKSLFPSEASTTKTPWTNFHSAQTAFEKIVPYETTTEDLIAMGFDPYYTPNIKILTYLDILQQFVPNSSITLDDIDPAVRECLESKDACKAYQLELNIVNNKRYGNLALDVLGFRKKTKITGWNFKALIIIQNDLVVYKLSSGQPQVDKFEGRKRPLGPLQEMDGALKQLMQL